MAETLGVGFQKKKSWSLWVKSSGIFAQIFCNCTRLSKINQRIFAETSQGVSGKCYIIVARLYLPSSDKVIKNFLINVEEGG